MRKIDATQGPLFKSILSYSIPLIITIVIQELYATVDKAVLGNMADTTAVAAVGLTVVITNLMTVGFVGLSSGASMVLARYIGQKDAKNSRDTMNTALISSLIFGAIVAVAGYLLSPTLLTMIDCPVECYSSSLVYIRIYYLAAPIMLFYNYGASILRTLGDSKSPMNYMMIGGAVNVVFNVILCLIFTEKVAAVAIATAVSNLISAVLIFMRLIRFEGDIRLDVKNITFNPKAFGLIIRFGIPGAVSDLVLPLANLQITAAINSFGVEVVAGSSAAISVQAVITSVHSGFSMTAATFMGQNVGAEKQERTRKSFGYCLLCGALGGELLGLFTILTGRFWLGLILGADATEAIMFGLTRMKYINSIVGMFAATRVMASALHAYGYPFFGSISSVFFILGARALWMQFVYPLNPTYEMILLCFVVSLTLNFLFYLCSFSIIHVRYKRGIYRRITADGVKLVKIEKKAD